LKAGGAIRGKGTGTSDEVPIMASNGEFVIKAKAVKAIGLEVLEALNAIADKPDEKDSKAEAMREYGDGSESETHETAEDAIEGMKCGGKVKKMAKGGLIDETDPSKTGYGPNTTEGMAARQAVHQTQLDSANTLAANNLGRGSLPVAPAPAAPAGAVRPTPVSGDGQMAYGDQMRNLGSALVNAPITALKTLVSAPGHGLSSTAASTPQPTPQTPAPAAPAGALPSTQPSAPAPTSTPVPGGDIPTAPVQAQPGVVTSADRLQSDAAINSVMGIRGSADQDLAARVDRLKAGTATADDWTTPNGGGVIATSNADANIKKMAGSATGRDTVNAAWAQRGAGIQATSDGKGGLTLSNADGPQKMQYTDASSKPTNDYKATNQYAEGMQNREKLLAAGAAVDQRAKESSDLQQLAARAVLEKQGASPKEKAAISQRTADAERALQGDATTRRAQDITAKGQEVQAGALRQSQQLAQNKDGREASASAMDQKSKQQLMDAQQEYLNAKTPEEQKAAERKLTTLGGKQGKAPTFHPGSRIKSVDGSETVTPAYVFDPTTGQAQEVQPQGQAKSQGPAEGSISTVNGKTAKFIGGKWVPQ
jgi:hypothetical protein